MQSTLSRRRPFAPVLGLIALVLPLLVGSLVPVGAQPGPDAAGVTSVADDVTAVPWAGAGPATRMRAVAALAPTTRAIVSTTGAFPDALASGVLQDDAMLVGATDGRLDDATKALLTGADVDEVIILGGVAAVPEDVRADLPAGADITRISGRDRTETAAEAALQVATGDVSTVLLARARGPEGNPSAGFIDAIGAGAWAAATGFPVLLVDNNFVTDATRQAMATLDPDELVVIGGTAAVSEEAAEAVAAGRDIRRVAGPERFTTAARIAEETRPDGAGTVVLLDGTDPDAWTTGFAAAHPAATRDAAILLSNGEELPAATLAALDDLSPSSLICAAPSAACNAARDAAGLPALASLGITPAPGMPLPVGTAVSFTSNTEATVTDDGGCLSGGTRSGDAARDCTVVVRVAGDGTLVGRTATVTWPALVPSDTSVEAPAEYLSILGGGRWDFDDTVDVRPAADITNSKGAQVDTAASVLRYGAEPGNVPVLWSNFGGAVPVPPDGLAVPVDSARFTRVVARVYSPAAGPLGLEFRSCSTTPNVDCINPASMVAQGRAGANLQPGWQTVAIDLAGDAAWTGNPIHTIYLYANGGTLIDDLRITDGSTARTITTTTAPGVAVRWDLDDDPGNNTDPTSALWGDLPGGVLDPNVLPPGRYWLHTVAADGTAGSTAGPIDIVSPGLSEGPLVLDGEWARDVRGNAWDFAAGGLVAGTDDVIELGNAERIDGAGLRGRNTNHSGDPYLVLDVPTPIDTSVWTHVVVEFSVDGPFDLAFAPGGGTMGRVLYQQGDHVWRNGNDIVAYPNQRTYVVEMTGPHSLEPNTPAWQAAPVTGLRFDPNEDEAPGRTWHVESIRLTRGWPTR